MIIDLAQMEVPKQSFELTIGVDELALENPHFRLSGDARVEGEILKGAAQIDVNGVITAPAELDCTRCLEPVSKDLTIEIAASFVASENFATDKEREVSPEDLDVDVLDGDRLDLIQLVREQIVLNFPEQVFCVPNCKGLCPKCGANRNLIDCKCDLDETDPRWAALKNLK